LAPGDKGLDISEILFAEELVYDSFESMDVIMFIMFRINHSFSYYSLL